MDTPVRRQRENPSHALRENIRDAGPIGSNHPKIKAVTLISHPLSFSAMYLRYLLRWKPKRHTGWDPSMPYV